MDSIHGACGHAQPVFGAGINNRGPMENRDCGASPQTKEKKSQY
jgi:hypothetical protein